MRRPVVDPAWRDPGTTGRRRRRVWILPVAVAVAALVAVVLSASFVVEGLRQAIPALRPVIGTSDPFAVPFGSNPESAAVGCNGQHDVTISGWTFRRIQNDVPAITIVDCHNVTITANDFEDDAEPIYVRDSTDVTITWNRYRNITGPHERNGSHRGNFVQLENTTGGLIAHNRGRGGDTEDIVSVYRSGGQDASNPLRIEDNVFEGTDWVSASGSGILLGDGGGDHVVVQRNVLINAGQVGIGVAGGSDIRILDNTVFGDGRAESNVGIYTWGQNAPCAAVQVRGNTVDFLKANGQPSSYWDAGNCGPVDSWADNRMDVTLDPDRLRRSLTGP